MLLSTVGKINAISDKLREEIEKKVLSFGESVRYQFDISRPNPDPDKRSGDIIWPHLYTLQPRTFIITDPYAPKSGQNAIKIGLVKELDEEGKKVTIWGKIQVLGANRGMFEVDLRDADGIATAMYLELHPKLKDGKFGGDTHKAFYRIDENQLATEKRAERSLKLKALTIAEGLSDADVRKFADAMTWKESNLSVVRNMIEEMAEQEPDYFLELQAEGGKTVEYQSTVQRAKDKGKISYDGVNHTYTWENGKVITMLAPESTKSDIEQMAIWLETGGEQAQVIYKKIQSLIK
jgi:hypothetical protein